MRKILFLATTLFCVWGTFQLNAAAIVRQTISGHVPAVTARLKPVDRLLAESDLDLSIALPLRNQETLTNFLEQLYDPASTNYHKFLSPEQFAAQFGPTESDYQSVIAFAETNGLTVTRRHSNRTLLNVNGKVSDIEKLFHVTLQQYEHPTETRTFFAPDVEPSVDLNVPLLLINGLNDYILPRPAGHAGRPGGTVATSATEPGSGSAPGGYYMGNDFRTAYAPGVALTGTGQTVALLELDGYYTNDIASYKQLCGLPNIPVTNVYIANFTGTPSSSANSVGEVSLDIEMVMSMAPGVSKVMVYEAQNCCYNWITILNQMVTDNAAKQISSSWLVGNNSSADQVYQQLAAQGQTYFQCSGDDGSFYSGIPQYCESPYLIAVGGTALTTGTGAKYSSEITWNNYFYGQGTNSSGGGFSSAYPIPTWQKSVSMAGNGGSTNYRNSPDISMTAYHVWVLYNNGGSNWFWGTSCAAPLWAGFTALVNQEAIAAGKTNVGFINPAIYNLAQSASYSLYFHDVTTGNNTNQTNPNSYLATTGYDLCTGWGTPTGSNLINALALGPGFPVVTQQPVSQTLPQGTNVTFTVNVSGTTPFTFQWRIGTTNLSDNGHFTGSLSNVLTLSNIQLADAGLYSLVIGNSSGTATSAVAALTVYIVPSISASPQNLAVPVNSNAAFSVTATGSPAPTYQWLFNGTNISLATASSYTVTNAQLTNQGNYSVIAANTYGSVTSSVATLVVQAPPLITLQPTNLQVLNPGSFARFTTTVTGSPPLSYQWMFSHDTFANATNITGRTNYFFINPSVTAADAGNYWLAITNSYGSATSTVSVVQINLAPAITTQPQSQAVWQGSNANFTVTATGSPLPVYQWYFNNGIINGATGAGYAIPNAQTNNTGNYFVVATNTTGSVTSSVVTLTVTPLQPPQFQSIVVLPSGQVQMILSGQAGVSYAIDASTDLVTWVQWTNFLNTNGIVQFTDSFSTNRAKDFYRARVAQ